MGRSGAVGSQTVWLFGVVRGRDSSKNAFKKNRSRAHDPSLHIADAFFHDLDMRGQA
jgi:hypothetical protein